MPSAAAGFGNKDAWSFVRALYSVYDIFELLRAGREAFGRL